MLTRPCKEVYITAFDGTKLFARYYHVAEDAPVQIQMHGYKSSAFIDFCVGSKQALQMDHNALVVNQRCGGKSGSCTITTFGIKERRDCLSWIEYVCERFEKDISIVLCGLSMGTATVLMVNDLNFPKNVKDIIADCPFFIAQIHYSKCQQRHVFSAQTYASFCKTGSKTVRTFQSGRKQRCVHF